jgi:threonine dehydratase
MRGGRRARPRECGRPTGYGSPTGFEAGPGFDERDRIVRRARAGGYGQKPSRPAAVLRRRADPVAPVDGEGGSVSAVPSPGAVEAALALVRRHFPPTRLVAARALGRAAGAPVLLKLESELPTGSFKPRGALYALAEQMRGGPVREVVASSTGNHGAAVAFAGRAFGVPAAIFLPERPNPVKRATIERLGASVVETGRDLAAAFEAARAHAERTGAYLLNDATDPHLPAGPATIGVEILEQAPDTRTIVVPMGDTALIRGIGAVAKSRRGDVRVVGVQAANAPAYAHSWREGRVVTTDSCDTLADGLATRTPDPDNVRAIRALVDEVVLVTEEQLLEAVRRLILDEHVVAEPAGAAATAAALLLAPLAGPTVVLVTGANLSGHALRLAAAIGGTPAAGPSPPVDER